MAELQAGQTGRLLLIDGSAGLYRAFYAIPGLTDGKGRPTNALFGFIRMVKHLAAAWQPTHWAVAFDGGLSADRLELLREYKAQRPGMPPDLRLQIDSVRDYLDRAAIPWVRIEGEEADDIIASLAREALKSGLEVLIGTSDKDLFQLVSEFCRIIPLSGKGGSMGPEEVVAKTGVEPSRIVDWLALVGDASDNIPGVPGIGPKTAARLLGAYDTLDGVLAHLSDLPDRTRVALEQSVDILRRNTRMVTLRGDVACPVGIGDLAVRRPDESGLIAFFEEYGLGSLAQELRQQDLL